MNSSLSNSQDKKQNFQFNENLMNNIKIINQTHITQPSNYPFKVYLSHLCSLDNVSKCSKPFRQRK